jgi:hypothetical protein
MCQGPRSKLNAARNVPAVEGEGRYGREGILREEGYGGRNQRKVLAKLICDAVRTVLAVKKED